MKHSISLPELCEKPACRYGYTDEQLQRIIGKNSLDRFYKFMFGQTMTLCTGKDNSCSEAHGAVTYTCDILQFLHGRPPLD